MVSFAPAAELLRSSAPVRYAAAGVAVLGGAIGAAVFGMPAHPHADVLVASADLPVGSVLTAADFQNVNTAQPGAQAISVSQEAAFIGRQLRVELPAGALLAPSDVGTFPPAGYAQVSLLLHPGQFPQNLENGQRVGVYPMGNGDAVSSAVAASAADGSAAGSGAAAITGQVVSVSSTPDSQGGTVVELLVPESQAQAVATASDAALVGLGADGT